MSKYNHLWEAIAQSHQEHLVIPFAKVTKLAGVPLDHSFLNYKHELLDYGYQVDKISLKKQEILISKCQ
ncbi:hypothetical protein FD27_GL001276 [Limosilactobacillus frumenti DSM 13145]|uniref:Uncharacterized protein n=1 Tax=Limosilactobacillus frumenti DSM 13145 TaxID=1423746 RepID=A0A0R1P273_9LACO|nr:hypothetical protein [Limosilactobacillus frumenti]KRL26140.1 hypothetical protein FD27_GL001276 [Limosilactobacillus frumenti DSM 13145]MBA2913657.1 hypothetical protein [Limosilactobacillus frumenti]QFG73001.1 hypothetical protein LF145_06580 [Limosilactobacillus frumenti]